MSGSCNNHRSIVARVVKGSEVGALLFEYRLAPADSWIVFSKYYVRDNDPCLPWISPLYGDLHGLPPMRIYVGEDEELLDDSIRFAEKAKAAGVDVTLQVGEGMVHCYPFLPAFIPEARQAMDDICSFKKPTSASKLSSYRFWKKDFVQYLICW